MIITFLTSFVDIWKSNFEARKDDFLVDKIIRKFSVTVMIIFASVLYVTVGLVGNHLSCWFPNEYPGFKSNYGQHYCFITKLYVPPYNTSDLPRRDELESHRIFYVPWTPYIFIFQAFLFYLPSLIWNICQMKSEFEVNFIVNQLNKNNGIEIAKRIRHLIKMDDPNTYHVNYYMNEEKEHMLVNHIVPVQSSPPRFTLCIGYICTKLFYLAVLFLQLFLLNYWFVDEYYKNASLFGLYKWNLSDRFPKLTLCRFEIYVLRDMQTHWVQCLVPVNVYVEKMFAIIWLWVWFLVLLVVIDLLLLIPILIKPSDSIVNGILDPDLQLKLKRQRFYPDASLLFALIKSNSNAHQADEVLKTIFENESSSQVSEGTRSPARSQEQEAGPDGKANYEDGDEEENGDREANYEENRLMERPSEVEKSRMKKVKIIDGRTVKRSDDDDTDENEEYDNNMLQTI